MYKENVFRARQWSFCNGRRHFVVVVGFIIIFYDLFHMDENGDERTLFPGNLGSEERMREDEPPFVPIISRAAAMRVEAPKRTITFRALL
ncbi:hypothetical protein CEXT_90761 [Caerostris extrusa]|uniref:Uncharacterized protein n=1 Tax=Caerostris extrusa TaxID=172846 RepID=A0AAV4P901_CAEEX|nr:hypothetical protein CEXT_90761 [Caerostris extrusa]